MQSSIPDGGHCHGVSRHLDPREDSIEPSTEAVMRALNNARQAPVVDAEKAAKIELFKERWKANQVLRAAAGASSPSSAATRVSRKVPSDLRVASALGSDLLGEKWSTLDKNRGENEVQDEDRNDGTDSAKMTEDMTFLGTESPSTDDEEEEAASNDEQGVGPFMSTSFAKARSDFAKLIPLAGCDEAMCGLETSQSWASRSAGDYQSALAGSNRDDGHVIDDKPRRRLTPIMRAVKGLVESPQAKRLVHELKELRRQRQDAAAEYEVKYGTDDRVRAWVAEAGVPNLADCGGP